MNETNETHVAVKEILHKQRAKQARRAVSDQLASYHDSLVDWLARDSDAFLQRIVARMQHDMQHDGERRQLAEPTRPH